jgi:hypothetical protein
VIDGRSYPTTAAQAAELTRRAALEAYFGRPWSHNLVLAIPITGPFSCRAFASSVEQVIGRHESLRTGFSRHKRPRQMVVDHPDPIVSLHDIADLNGPRAQQRRVEQILHEACLEPFLAHQTTRLRATVVSLGGDRHVACVIVDHIAADLWTLGVIARELTECYEAAVRGTPHGLPAGSMQYIDFAQSQEAAGTEARDLAFWRAELEGMGSQPPLALPGAKCEFVTSFEARVTSRRVPADISARLAILKDRHRTTTFGVWLSAFVAHAFREAEQRDIGILMPVANRMRPETRSIVGWLANQIIVRVSSWESLLRALKHQAVACDDPRLAWPSPGRPRGVTPQVLLNAVTDSEIPSMRFGRAQGEPAPLPGNTHRHVLDIRFYEGVLGASVAATYPVQLYDARTVTKAINGTFRSIRHLCDAPDAVVDVSSPPPRKRSTARSVHGQAEGVA